MMTLNKLHHDGGERKAMGWKNKDDELKCAKALFSNSLLFCQHI